MVNRNWDRAKTRDLRARAARQAHRDAIADGGLRRMAATVTGSPAAAPQPTKAALRALAEAAFRQFKGRPDRDR
jgi:hypothetical protein